MDCDLLINEGDKLICSFGDLNNPKSCCCILKRFYLCNHVFLVFWGKGGPSWDLLGLRNLGWTCWWGWRKRALDALVLNWFEISLRPASILLASPSADRIQTFEYEREDRLIQILVGIEPSCVRCLIKFEDLVTIEWNLFKSIFHVVSQLVARLEEGIAEHIDSINYCLNVVWWSLEILSLHFVGSGEGLSTFCS